ncbi:hypothetical protein EBR25_13025 [bacterium]|nr:hypothetical protein [bacterium]
MTLPSLLNLAGLPFLTASFHASIPAVLNSGYLIASSHSLSGLGFLYLTCGTEVGCWVDVCASGSGAAPSAGSVSGAAGFSPPPEGAAAGPGAGAGASGSGAAPSAGSGAAAAVSVGAAVGSSVPAAAPSVGFLVVSEVGCSG